MEITQLTHRLGGVRRSPNGGFLAHCPAHNDKHSSLSVSASEGRILLNCFAGCPTQLVVKALGIEWKDLFDDKNKLGRHAARDPNAQKTFSRNGVTYFASPSKKIVDIYQYRDEKGELLYENVRYHPKDFRQRQFDGTGKPVWNLQGVKRVPYRLSELLAGVRAGADIFLCEGEKDANAVRELGLTASSFKGWTAEMNRYIKGSHVILVQDHDKPGLKQAEEAASVIFPDAKSVKIIDVFANLDLPDKLGPDIADYIHQCVRDEGLGNDEIAERLSGLVETTLEWKQVGAASNLFRVQSGNEWINESKNRPSPKQLFGEFWFEGELCILFADTNVGKSILAVQIADRISNGGLSVPPTAAGDSTRAADELNVSEAGGTDFPRIETLPQKIVYFDFELTEKQFEARFSERVEGSDFYTNHYRFHSNFLRAAIDPTASDFDGFSSFEDYLNDSLDKTVVSSGARVLILDNRTYLRDETENARNALPLMKYLKELKSKYGLSILALAHTPKRDASKPLTRNDLQGSKMLINFCDSSFAIGESAKEHGVRYLKQIKARNTEIVYHTGNVLLAKVRKAGNFLGFEFVGTSSEREHLKSQTDKDQTKEAIVDKVRELSACGTPIREIAEQLGISKSTVGRYLQELRLSVPNVPDVPSQDVGQIE
jgi:hypothetical protein